MDQPSVQEIHKGTHKKDNLREQDSVPPNSPQANPRQNGQGGPQAIDSEQLQHQQRTFDTQMVVAGRDNLQKADVAVDDQYGHEAEEKKAEQRQPAVHPG